MYIAIDSLFEFTILKETDSPASSTSILSPIVKLLSDIIASSASLASLVCKNLLSVVSKTLIVLSDKTHIYCPLLLICILSIVVPKFLIVGLPCPPKKISFDSYLILVLYSIYATVFELIITLEISSLLSILDEVSSSD